MCKFVLSAVFLLLIVFSFVQLPFAAHGYGAMFTLATMDRYYKTGLTVEEVCVAYLSVFACLYSLHVSRDLTHLRMQVSL